MLDILQSCLKKEFQFSHMAGLINHLGNIIAIVQADFTKDQDAKNAAIDAVCQILQGYKNTTTEQSKS